MPDPKRAGQVDGGFLVTYVHEDGQEKSEMVVYDAATMASVPVARVALPARVPHGFHAAHVGEAQLVIHVTDRNDHQPRFLKLQVREFNARRCAYRLFVGYKEPVKSISIRNFTVHNTLFKTQRVALIPSSFSRRKKSIHGIKFKTEVFTVLLLRQFNDSLKKYRFNR